MEAYVNRTYKVNVWPSPEALNGKDYPLEELIDACTREADVGNLDGTMLYMAYDEAEGGDTWMNSKDRYGERVIHEVEYSAQEIDQVIDIPGWNPGGDIDAITEG